MNREIMEILLLLAVATIAFFVGYFFR